MDKKLSLTRDGGIVPDRSLYDKSSISMFIMPDKEPGILPDKLLRFKSRTCSFLKFPNSGQIGPVRKLLLRSNNGGKLMISLYCNGKPLQLVFLILKNGKSGNGSSNEISLEIRLGHHQMATVRY
ncbi:hypothetical protein Ccrd_002303 [Cynara cardunculus var. scolymus]|uniref:Uncharacterized protein n=1 Tax=Cynara cardunculus var. scolymus TaxID=59895 RepID=A0A103XRK2_CYNCS|nr:hypothetical protein Ccrd_002303 [Cynara cardunculus var. scolymus]